MASSNPPAYSENSAATSDTPAPPYRRSSSFYNNATDTFDVEEGGLSTQTKLGDDGRIDIDIHETDTRLTQQIERIQLATVQEELAGAPSRPTHQPTEHPPPLNVVIQVVGSRGDVQPFVALGLVLKNNYGHRIRLATHGNFKSFVEDNGLEFFDIGGDPAELMAFMVKNPGLIPKMQSLKDGDIGKRRKGMAEILQSCWKSCADANEAGEAEQSPSKAKPFVAHAIIANPPSFAHIHCAEKLGIPLHIMFTMPWSPTREFPQPIANIKSSDASGGSANIMSYTIVEMMTWQGLGDIINKFREDTLRLPELSQAAATTMIQRLKIPYTYCWSPALIPKPVDWGPHIDIAGFYFLSLGSNYEPETSLAEFLASGPAPVYIGFGSIVVDDPNAMTKLIFEAVKKTGQRALVSQGWGGLGGNEMDKPEGILMLGNCPHDWLFKHVSCVVHHGGAGTTAAGIALGRPTVIVPFFGDQPFWGAMVARAGAGPEPIPAKKLTADNLADAILYALKPETLERAQELGNRIREEKGTVAGAASFHAQMNVDALRCTMAPNRPAVWRVKTKPPNDEGLRLSAFAATVLSNEGLLDVNLLKLYRPYEYDVVDLTATSNSTDANPFLSTAGTVATGVINWPIGVGKAIGGVVYEPYKGARKGGWRGFGKGLGKGLGGFFFPHASLTIGAQSYGVRAIYQSLKKKYGDPKLSFILATHFAQGFEDVKVSTEEERMDVLRRWNEISPDLKLMESKASKNKAKRSSYISAPQRENVTATVSESKPAKEAPGTRPKSKIDSELESAP